ncbi:MAG: methyltransferase domain-containing protein [Thermomicrobiales bacterium]
MSKVVPPDDELIADPVAAWDAVADLWDAFVEGGHDRWREQVHGPALLAACGEVAGARVLDLGCGQGWFSRQLAMRGAQVTGVDMARGQIAHALRHEEEQPLGIDYRHLDAREIADVWPAGAFDLITGCMVLQDTPHAGEILRAARQVLAPGGQIALSVPHPVTSGAEAGWLRGPDEAKGARWIDHYFQWQPDVLDWKSGDPAKPWRTPRWHRTLETWGSLIEAAGLCLTQMAEPRPSPAQIAADPSMEPASRIPYFLIMVLQPHLLDR